MNYTISGDNFALTIFIPYNCKNNCEFCTSKQDYVTHRPNVESVSQAIKKVKNIPFSDIVISGGEPFADLDLLNKILFGD